MFTKNSRLRLFLIPLFLSVGITLVFYGFSLTGQMIGLLLMLLGVLFLILALFLYNKPYK